jgi:hypothetical protein
MPASCRTSKAFRAFSGTRSPEPRLTPFTGANKRPVAARISLGWLPSSRHVLTSLLFSGTFWLRLLSSKDHHDVCLRKQARRLRKRGCPQDTNPRGPGRPVVALLLGAFSSRRAPTYFHKSFRVHEIPASFACSSAPTGLQPTLPGFRRCARSNSSRRTPTYSSKPFCIYDIPASFARSQGFGRPERRGRA